MANISKLMATNAAVVCLVDDRRMDAHMVTTRVAEEFESFTFAVNDGVHHPLD